MSDGAAEGGGSVGETIQGLFEAQAERTPDALAVLTREGTWTYSDLDARANRLSRHLRTLGVGQETLVGIHVERSLEMIVGLLGILKAGGAYVPLDPGYPLERVAFMLEDTRAPVLLTLERLAERLPTSWAQLVCLDADWDGIAGLSASPLPSVGSPSSLAYVMYTSGSTGQPKGVAIPHRGVLRLVRGTDYASMGPSETFLQLAPLSFDASTFEIWAPLLNGGRLAIAASGTPSLQEIGEELRRHQVTTLWLTAALFHLMVDERPEDLRGLRQLLAGGDALSVPHVRRFLREVPDCRLINGYGPTESTTFAACHTVRSLAGDALSVPIGRPIAETEIRILDSAGVPAGPGIAGEIHVGGQGLARGYWKQPALTQERFIPDPLDPGGEARLYRSGDLGRFLPDGTIEFLGRIDRQVKIRGFRVELEEIEATLRRHPDIREVAVLAEEGSAGVKRLIAYAVVNPESSTSDEQILRSVADRLPDYMVPFRLVRLLALPLSANGKIDRSALPARAAATREGRVEPPDSSVERQIAAIWEAVLDVSEVGRDENFFDLGGDSLLAVEVHSKLARELRIELGITDLFEHPTIRSLAARVGAASQKLIPREAAERGRRQRGAVQRRGKPAPEALGG